MLIQEDYFRNIFNTVREGILILDENMRVLSANRSFFNIFNIDTANTIGSLLYDLCNGQWDIPHLRVLLEDVLPKNDTVDNYEIEHNFESIGQKTMLLNACKIREKKNDLPIILLAIEDITERRKLEEAHSKLAAIVEFAEDAIIGEDLEGTIVSWNRGAEIAYGYIAKEIVGKSISLLMPTSHPDEYKDVLAKIACGETIKHYETKRRRKDGQEIDVSLSISPVKDKAGEIISSSTIARDITERKRLEGLLTESEVRYRRIFETASDGIVLLEKSEGDIAHVNPSAEKMTGYSEEECIGKSLQDIGVSVDLSDFQAIMQALNKSGIINYKDVSVKTKSGQDIYTDIYMVDRAPLAQCNIRDVTERKRADEKLKEEKRFIENALNTLKDVFFVFDLEGRFLRWNKTMNAVTGYIDSEIASMKPVDFFKNGDTGRIAKAIQTVVKEGSVSVDALLVTKDCRQIPYEFSAALLSDANGNPLGISGVGRDITERKRTEEALKENEAKYRLLYESSRDAIMTTTPDEGFLGSNKAAIEMFGCRDEQEFISLSPADVSPEFQPDGCRSTDKAQEMMRLALEKGSHYFEWTHRKMDGTIFFADVLFTRMELGSQKLLQATVRDIAERKHLEAQLRHAQKMEAIGTLAGGIAHDFNNILNVILGYGTMVMDKLEADSSLKENMNEVLVAANRAANLINRLLVFSRKHVVEVKPVNINELILDLQKMLVRIIRESIDFNLDLADRPLRVLADAGQIEQVLMNLAVNATDAMPFGGRLTIGTGLEEIDDEYIAVHGYGRHGMYAIITVSDTGYGMDAETQKKIFEPFFSTKGIGVGTGLGLAISYEIIKQHRGYIKVYSEPGEGSVFTIYLPLIEDAASLDRKTEAPDAVKGGNETVLVVEDNASVRELTRIVLESFGYGVITAEDGEDAITKFMENRAKIQLVILDMIMPKKNGMEVSEVLRKASSRTKILFVSGYTMDIIKDKGLTESGFDFIHKPVRTQDLLKKVREILDR